MQTKGKLILEDGSVYNGYFLGNVVGSGEVVFNTSVLGYQEILTDPCYCNQIIVMTYPLIGNYGVNPLYNQNENSRSYVKGLVMGELCDHPSNWRSEVVLSEFLQKENVPCLTDVDTRAVTRKIRDFGIMRGVIVPDDMSESEIKELFSKSEEKDVVSKVTRTEVKLIPNKGHKVAVIDYGIKKDIIDFLLAYDFDLTVYPSNTSSQEILSNNPSAIVLSNGPGNPKDVQGMDELKKLLDSKKPVLGIGLGFQLICLALGADTYKMKFGHHGGNQPVKDKLINKVFTTSQNHCFTIKEESLVGTGLQAIQHNVNDNTVEGVVHETKPIIAVQYHPEAIPDSDSYKCLFQRFLELIGGRKNA